MRKLTGRCLCGEIEYEVPDEFLYACYCHCSECRSFSGTAGSAIAGIPAHEFKLTKGESSITRFKKTPNAILCFCATCGSSLYSEKPETIRIHIRYGSIKDTPSMLPRAHIHTKSKAAWYEINDELPQFTEMPPAS